MAPTPIITCGNNQNDATGVHKGMKPEFDVIYAGYSLPDSLQEVPLILSHRAPPASSLHTQIGSNDFTTPPRAIVVGGGYTDEQFDALRAAIVDACGSKRGTGVGFFRADNALTDRLVAEGAGPAKHAEGYAQAIGKRLKMKLGEAGVERGLEEAQFGEVIYY